MCYRLRSSGLTLRTLLCVLRSTRNRYRTPEPEWVPVSAGECAVCPLYVCMSVCQMPVLMYRTVPGTQYCMVNSIMSVPLIQGGRPAYVGSEEANQLKIPTPTPDTRI